MLKAAATYQGCCKLRRNKHADGVAGALRAWAMNRSISLEGHGCAHPAQSGLAAVYCKLVITRLMVLIKHFRM